MAKKTRHCHCLVNWEQDLQKKKQTLLGQMERKAFKQGICLLSSQEIVGATMQ